MRRSTYLIFINAIILVVIFALTAQSLFVYKRLGTASAVKGKVLVQHAGQNSFTPLSEGDPIQSQDTLKTGADGKARLEWAEGTVLQIMPRSDLIVLKTTHVTAKKADISQFRLNSGTIFVNIAKFVAPESKFEVETPTTVASARDTIFRVGVERGRTQIAAYQGSVKVSSGEGSEARACLIQAGRVAISGAIGAVETRPDAHTGAGFKGLLTAFDTP